MKTIHFSTIVIFACIAYLRANTISVDSVTVDSVWSSDSSWYDSEGIHNTRASRDCIISFIPRGKETGTFTILVSISLDGGNSWEPEPNPLRVLQYRYPYYSGRKSSVVVRVFGSNRPEVVFKITARNYAPEIVAVNVPTRQFKNTEYSCTVSTVDLDSADACFIVAAAEGLRIDDMKLSWKFETGGTYDLWAIVSDGLLSDTFTWSANVISTSRPRIDVVCSNYYGVIHPKFLHKQFVGILYRKLDSTRIELKTHPDITNNFELTFDSPVEIGDSVIVDCFLDSLADTVFIKPANPSLSNLGWPEPAARWTLNEVVYDDRGGHGMQFNYVTANNAKFDISDLYDRVVEQ